MLWIRGEGGNSGVTLRKKSSMAIRIYTELEENERIKNELMSYVAQRTRLLRLWPKDFVYYPWQLTDDGRLTLSHPRMAGKGYFRVSAYRGNGMVSFELEAAPNIYMVESVYREYHKKLMELLYDLFRGRFYLMERTPFEDRSPKLDIPRYMLDEGVDLRF